jgi:ribosome-associated protein
MYPDDDIHTRCGLLVPAQAVHWRFDRAGGPGGQHRNKTSTRAHIVVDLTLLEGRAELVERVREHLGDVLGLSEGTSRSQWRNRVRLTERVAETIDAAARPRDERKPSRPTRTSVERRLGEKRRNSQRKDGRQHPFADRDE